jgi:hypothetical protein
VHGPVQLLAECSWHFGLVLVRQGKRREALELLRVCVAYEQEIGHANAMEHAALLARLETGEDLPVEALWGPTDAIASNGCLAKAGLDTPTSRATRNSIGIV